MKRINRNRLIYMVLLAVSVCWFAVFACGCTKENNTTSAENTPAAAQEVTPTDAATPTVTPTQEPTPTAEPTPAVNPTEGKTLVIVFSQTGNTKRVAEVISTYLAGAPDAKKPDAELFVIEAAVPYTSEDINWNNSNSRTTKEQNDPSARPEIGSAKIDLTGVTRIFLGYPIWFAKEPRIMDTFVESYDFTGITVIPFCTSGSTGIAQSKINLEKLAGSGIWHDGKRFAATAKEKEIVTWLMDSGYLEPYPIDWVE